jgi:ribose/xylose/arabinose/galactoside ABC-type transport system permease subunit
VVVVGINSFIATLGMLFFLRGAAFVISDEEPVRLEQRRRRHRLRQAAHRAADPRMLIFVVAFVALQIFVTRVRVGREFYAVGGNREAAYDAGIPVEAPVFTGFMISGFVARSPASSTPSSAPPPTRPPGRRCCSRASLPRSSAGCCSTVVAARSSGP